jgi:putative oxidoreductase
VSIAMFEQADRGETRNALTDWMSRGAVALFFVLAGADKFSGGWVKLFQEIGFGQWFRYFTGVVEILGGVLVLIPWTVTAGLALLACTMACAALILVFVVGRPADSVFSGVLLIFLVGFWWTRRG